jgi:PIN domain nuclease of toxin-antitoxin system
VLLPREIARNGFGLLPIALTHTAAFIDLPFHHRDPFDRLLIAQARVEAMPIVGVDPAFDSYGVERIW